MTINEYQTEALRTAAGMNHPNNDEILLNGFEAERSLHRQEGDV